MDEPTRLTPEQLAAESGTALPAKEVLSLLDLNVDLDLGLDLAAPIDLAVAANANVAAPIEAAASANLLSLGSTAAAGTTQDVLIDQGITGEATADAPQTSVLDQGDDTVDAPAVGGATVEPATVDAPAVDGVTTTLTDGNLLNVDVNVALDADLAAPVAGAVALNGNVAAPVDAAVAANIGSIDSEAVAVSDQSTTIIQRLDDVSAEATATQDSTITQ